MQNRKTWAVAMSVVMLVTIGLARAEFRTWKSSNGEHQFEADVVKIEKDTVTLVSKEGNVVVVTISKLSEADQKYLENRRKNQNPGDKLPKPSRNESGDALPNETKDDSKFKGPISPATLLTNLENQAQLCRSAKDALQLYCVFLADKAVSQEAKEGAQFKLRYWEDAAAKDLVRFGKKWVTRSVAKEAKSEAESLVAQGLELLKTNDGQGALVRFEKASKADPESTLADSVMGIAYAKLNKQFDKAKRHFLECYRRDPEDVGSLNNLAIVEAMLNEHPAAIRYFRFAMDINSTFPELGHNVGRAVAQSNLGNLGAAPSHRAAYADIYAKLQKNGGSAVDASKGWLYLLPMSKPLPDEPIDSRELIVYGGGTGFVVHPNYVLTNRHVVEEAAALAIKNPDKAGPPELAAKLVATSKVDDLALLECNGLTAKPLGLSGEPLQRGTEIMLFGFPKFDILGVGLKSTRGSIVGSTERGDGDLVLYDAIYNPGNSGGPVCDSSSRVIAIHSVAMPQLRYAGGVPAARAVEFLKQQISEFQPAAEKLPGREWPDVDRSVSQSVALILCKKAVLPELNIEGASHSRSIEDRSCVLCRGSSKIKCTVRDCARGTVPSTKRVLVYNGPGGKIYEDKKIRINCDNCHGTGFVDCPSCSGGIDPGLR